MVILMYKNGQTYSFELKNREREMDFVIDISRAHAESRIVIYKVTNKFGIVRRVHSMDIERCRYSKEKLTIADNLINEMEETVK